MSDEVAIRVEGVSKSFKLPHEKSDSIKNKIVNFAKNKKGYEIQEALKDITFEVKKGEFFGIVGRNGSGKSTLLKLISGIYTPDSGDIQVNGKLTPFIELGVGFIPELSGRENVFLNGALLGFNRKEMEAMYDEIVAFAELERFMDQKLKNYSSGMQVRLAFSIAIRANTDILVLDEVLAVGDEAFQRKCEEYFTNVKKKGKTIVLVTHSMDSVRKYCNKAIMLQSGEIRIVGDPEDVANEYSLENLRITGAGTAVTSEQYRSRKSPIKNLEVKLLSEGVVNQTEGVRVNISYDTTRNIKTMVYVSIVDIDRNSRLFGTSSPVQSRRKNNVTLNLGLSALNDTNMKVQVSIRGMDKEVLHYLSDNHSPIFSLRRTDYPDSKQKTVWAIFFDRGRWT